MQAFQSHQSTRGFTLIELFIVVIVAGILAALAIPRFMASTTKSKSAEAMQILKQIHVQQRAYRQEYDTYWGNGAIGDRNNTDSFSKLGIHIMESARYTYSIVAEKTSFTCTATSNLDDDDTVDTWIINDRGELIQTVNDVVD
ncbi:MAG: hypothetical protein Kow0074_14520 [Candidatus Zixiibacteriota bacterium]